MYTKPSWRRGFNRDPTRYGGDILPRKQMSELEVGLRVHSISCSKNCFLFPHTYLPTQTPSATYRRTGNHGLCNEKAYHGRDRHIRSPVLDTEAMWQEVSIVQRYITSCVSTHWIHVSMQGPRTYNPAAVSECQNTTLWHSAVTYTMSVYDTT
jgi:hypothetical protein